MTLNIPKFIKKTIEKQMTIQHFNALVKVFTKESIPSNIVQKIKEQFGDTYLDDSNFVVFYKGRINKKGLKKIFNITDKALGEDANRLTDQDFKILKLSDSDDASEFNQTNSQATTVDDEQTQPEEQSNSDQLDQEIQSELNSTPSANDDSQSEQASDTTNDDETTSDIASIGDDTSTSDDDDKTEEQPTEDQSSSDDTQEQTTKDTDTDTDDNSEETSKSDEASKSDETNDEKESDEKKTDVDDEINEVLNEQIGAGDEIENNIDEIDDEIEQAIHEDDAEEIIPVRFFFLKITINQ